MGTFEQAPLKFSLPECGCLRVNGRPPVKRSGARSSGESIFRVARYPPKAPGGRWQIREMATTCSVDVWFQLNRNFSETFSTRFRAATQTPRRDKIGQMPDVQVIIVVALMGIKEG